MKRPYEQQPKEEQPLLQLPIEVLLVIFKAIAWHSMGAVARTSHCMMEQLTTRTVLIAIMKDLKNTPLTPLPRWLLLAIPAHFFYKDDVYRHQRNFPRKLVARTRTILNPLSYLGESRRPPNFIIAGGYVASNMIHEDPLYSGDIDVFVERKALCDGLDCRIQKSNFDFVSSTFPGNRLAYELDCFDLSIVQVGYVADDPDSGLYRTPLSLYTEYSHDIVALPDQESVFYSAQDILLHSQPTQDQLRFCHDNCEYPILDKFRDHCENRHLEAFHVCLQCKTNENLSDLIKRWFRRIAKYGDRFSSFSITFCRPPFRSRYA